MDKINEYKIPHMSEINALEHNGINVVSTFSGCGGSTLGYKMAGLKVLYANEFIESAQETYRANHKHTYLDTRDIRQIKPTEILNIINKKQGELDILDGSPPCASFSRAGQGSKNWGKVRKYSEKSQRVDDLFFEYIRILDGLQPKAFVAENVSAITNGQAIGYFKNILQEMKNCGYQVKCGVLNAKHLGVPQNRERAIFIGIRNDLNKQPVFPTVHKQKYVVKDAISNLEPIKNKNSYFFSQNTKTYKLWENTPQGAKFDQANKKLFNATGCYTSQKLSKFKVCPAITTSADLYHWEEPRRISVEEAKRFASIPQDFILTGGISKQWERIGRCVPPFMMKEIATAVSNTLKS